MALGRSRSPVRPGSSLTDRGGSVSPLPPLPRSAAVVRVRQPRRDHDAMPKLRRVRIVTMGLEDPALRPAVHRNEPGAVLELGSSARYGADAAAVPAISMDELDRAQHVDLASLVTPGAPSPSHTREHSTAALAGWQRVTGANRRTGYQPTKTRATRPRHSSRSDSPGNRRLRRPVGSANRRLCGPVDSAPDAPRAPIHPHADAFPLQLPVAK